MCSSLLLQAGTSARAGAIISAKAKEVQGVQAKGCLGQCLNPGSGEGHQGLTALPAKELPARIPALGSIL